MGWTFTHKEKGESIKSFFEREFSTGNNIIDCKVVNKVAYIAYKNKNNDVVALVCLLDYKPKQHFNFGYKDMDESMNPYYYDCPKSILDLLSPTSYEGSLNWRKTCEEISTKKELTKTLKVGELIKFQNEMSFGRYGKAQVFQVVDVKKGHYFATKLGITVKLTKSSLTNSNNVWSKI